MSNVSDYHEGLWRAVVSLEYRRCPLCGELATDCHHIFFRSQGDWVVIYDSDYGVKLCHDCHEEKPFAPHKDNNLFFEKFIPILMQTDEPRARKILQHRVSIKKPQPLPPDWKFISSTLRNKYKELEKTSWMDADIDGGASI